MEREGTAKIKVEYLTPKKSVSMPEDVTTPWIVPAVKRDTDVNFFYTEIFENFQFPVDKFSNWLDDSTIIRFGAPKITAVILN